MRICHTRQSLAWVHRVSQIPGLQAWLLPLRVVDGDSLHEYCLQALFCASGEQVWIPVWLTHLSWVWTKFSEKSPCSLCLCPHAKKWPKAVKFPGSETFILNPMLWETGSSLTGLRVKQKTQLHFCITEGLFPGYKGNTKLLGKGKELGKVSQDQHLDGEVGRKPCGFFSQQVKFNRCNVLPPCLI